jgi:pimeloyl-ACP methyl ester carboxylesterase
VSHPTRNDPLVVLIHGAWHGAWCWAALQSELDSRGIPSLAVDLPGHGASTEPLGDLVGDAAHVAAVIESLDRPVVLVGHSYGGAVIGQAAPSTANVVHLVFLAAYALDVGEDVIGLTKAMPPAEGRLGKAIVIDGDTRTSTIDPELAHDAFYGHCDPAISAAHVARLGRQPVATFVQPATNAAWRSLPSTYVRCLDDAGIPIAHQDFMAARCTNVETLDTDHSPFSSMPVETAEIVARVVRSA